MVVHLQQTSEEKEVEKMSTVHDRMLHRTSIHLEPDVPSRYSARHSLERRQPIILVIVTGGTICMTNEGINASLRPAPLAQRLTELTEFSGTRLPFFEVLEWEELIDSSDVNLSTWIQIVNNINDNYCNYDGFVVLHGTDSLSYTASALSFMLENLNKPVVLTGAMLPMHHLQTDARNNFSVALKISAYSQITEVCVLFGSRLLRGNRATKLDCSRMDAFDSPNFQPLGNVGVEITVDDQLLLMPSKRAFRVFRGLCMNIVVVTITPEFHPSLLYYLFSSPIRPLAVILKLYGSGTAPTKNPAFLATLRSGIELGVEVMSVSQCVSGTCSLLTYESGALLYHIGVIEGKDMTVEAAFAKIAYLMGKGYTGDKLRYLMETDIRGEVTERPKNVTGQASLASIIDHARILGRNRLHHVLMPDSTSSQLKQDAVATSPPSIRSQRTTYKLQDEEAATDSTAPAARPDSLSDPGDASGRGASAYKDSSQESIEKLNSAQDVGELKQLAEAMKKDAKEFRQLVEDIRELSLKVHYPETDSEIHSKNEDAQQRGSRWHIVPATIEHHREQEQPKADCVQPKADCVQPKADCVQPKADCVQPKADCVQPKPDCVQPKADCVQP